MRHALLLITQTEINILQKNKTKHIQSVNSHGNLPVGPGSSASLARFKKTNLGTSKGLLTHLNTVV